MKIGYFPGCSLHGTAPEYEASLKLVAKAADIELVEIEDWNCCGATAAHSMNRMLSIALPARNLAIAEKMGLEEVVVPCAACYSRLLFALNEFKLDEKVRMNLQPIIETEFKGNIKILNVLDFLEKYVMDALKNKVDDKFKKKAACYYGCLLVRPPKLTNSERWDDPLRMEAILKKIGIDSIDWSFKTECCGAGLSIARTDIVGKLSGKIIEDAKDRGADMIVTACPMCQSNLDMRRGAINNYLKKDNNIPAIFITQLIGLAFGYSEKDMQFDKLFVPISFSNNNFSNNNDNLKMQKSKVKEVKV